MCLKTSDTQSQTALPGSGTRAWSITRRLTLLYVASTTALLLLSAGFLYRVLQQNLEAREHALLAGKIEVLRLLLREHPGKTDVLESEVEHEASASQVLKYYIRILDARQRLLFETHGMGEIAPSDIFPAPSPSETPALEFRTARGRDTFRVVSARAPASAPGEGDSILQLALDVSQDQSLLASYRSTLLLVLLAGIGFAAAAGAFIARKGMQPLAEITQTAQQITASNLHARVAGRRWPEELAELAGAFDGMLDRLQDSFTRLAQFSADLAHELRTPINNLRGEAEVALARGRTPDEYQQILASSLEEHERLSRMIDGLLFVARAENPDAAVTRVRFDVRKELDAVREFYEALAGEQNVEIVCEGSASLTGDPVLFRRAVSNLLANSLQHTPAGGRVCLSAALRHGETVEVTVHDTGSGIAPEHLPKIFDRFYRPDHSRSRTPGGSGLGLAIVQSVMRLHGGGASIESTVGNGTTVKLTFPPVPER